MAPLLSVQNLSVTFRSIHGPVQAIRNMSYTLGQEKLGIVGESGSGKSMSARAILKLTPKNAEVRADHIEFGEIDLLRASERQMLRIRGERISMILQDPKFSLNPVIKVGEQIAEAYRVHHKSSSKDARHRALKMLADVQIREPSRVYHLYPHEISGGMGQRVMIAMMLIPEPAIIIADEPTSALDVTVRHEVLTILNRLIERRGIGLIFISHDLNLVRRFCDRVLIMYAGRIVEAMPAADLDQAQHPYTQGLLRSLPRIHERRTHLPVLERDPAWLEAS